MIDEYKNPFSNISIYCSPFLSDISLCSISNSDRYIKIIEKIIEYSKYLSPSYLANSIQLGLLIIKKILVQVTTNKLLIENTITHDGRYKIDPKTPKNITHSPTSILVFSSIYILLSIICFGELLWGLPHPS